MDRWGGRVALVTGASSGIGANVARRLVAAGMKVVGAAPDVQRVQALADQMKGQPGCLIPIKCDVTKDDQVLSMFAQIKQELGGVDVCINNAGLCVYKTLLEGHPEDWRRMLDLNVVALCLCTREAVASMRERGVDDGHIIHLNSLAGHCMMPMLVLGFYCGTKHMVTTVTEALRLELKNANSKIRVSGISPGHVKTEILVNGGKTEEEAKEFYQKNPHFQPDDVTDSIIHVLSAPPHVQIHNVLLRPL